ncbi:MAG: hypothetical protein QOC81_1682 [Thermoanaerobaculia bacterium]|jgi:RHS repeat-associated protein|nr:hypothetical protein [Thermoanaerobaculia bacterium]
MRNCRRLFQSLFGRVVVYGLAVAALHYAIDPYNYLYAIEVQRAKEAEVRAIAAKMNVDPEFLLHPQGRKTFDFKSLFSWLGLSEKAESQAPDVPLDIKESVARVKSRYALVAADTVLSKIAQAISDLPAAKNKGQMKAHLNSVLRLIDKDFLPAVPDGLPGSAKSRDAQMRAAMNKLRNDVKQVLKGKDALEEANLDTTLSQLRTVLNGQLSLKKHEPRWTKDPFPFKDTYKKATQRELRSNPIGGSSSSTISALSTPAPKQTSAAPMPAQVTALANQLITPARIFAWVHDHIEWEPYSGVAKGSLGTLQEGRGNDWDQALLLRDLLAAKGYDARLEWGTVTLPMRQAMNLAGTEDPTQAANLLATAGFNGVVLTVGGAPVGVQMAHAWVRAFIPYIPNRGATAGTADTWVRMDPSFKRYEYQQGIRMNGRVTWSEDEYLQTSAMRAPADFYGDKIWSYIRANNLNCNNLAQVPKTGTIKQENFPFVPSTLTAKIDHVDGSAIDAPADQIQSVNISISDVANYNVKLADVWGRKLTITFAPATPDDAAIINSYGGIFNTPAYLIRLKPVISLDDQPVAEGAPVAAGTELDLNLGFHQPNVADDSTHHDMIAGETHTLVFDAGNFPDSLIESRINRLKTLTNADQVLSEKLYLVGLRYMQHVDDGISFASGVRWQRAVKRVFEGDVRRQINVSYTVAGAPLRLAAAENNIDVARLLVGIVPIDNDLSNKAEALQLAGLQSSYLEGAIWEEMDSQQGISAAKALLLARMAGQQIQTVNSSNVNIVLANANLSSDVEEEIRGAVAQGRVARIAPNEISLGHWTGTGYILEDPITGAATYPISGGLAGGSETGQEVDSVKEMLGAEEWAEGSDLADVIRELIGLFGGSVGPKSAPSTTQSDPVNMSTGNMYYGATDFSIAARGVPVMLTRVYNSRSTYNGPFGHGWTFNYGEQLIPLSGGSLLYRESDGTEHEIAFDGTRYIAPAGKHFELTANYAGWTLRFKEGQEATFDMQGRLAGQSDPNGNTVTIQRDSNGMPAAIVDATGRVVLTFTVAAGKIVEVTDLTGLKTSYTYDGDDLVRVTDVAGKIWSMAYDTVHNLTEHRDPLGNGDSYDYDSDDRLFHHVDALGADEFFHYDIAGRQSVITDRRGGERFVQFDDLGRATLESDPAGNVMKATFDADNNRTSILDSRGFATALEYDAKGNVIKETNPDGGVVLSTYDGNSRLLASTDPLGVTATNSYDGNGNLLTTSRTVGSVVQTTTNTYDAHGQVLTTVDPNGGVTRNTWDPVKGTMLTRTDALNNVTTFVTDTLGRVVSVKDPANNETSSSYDARGRKLSTADAYGLTTTYVYDDAGRRSEVRTPRGTWKYVHDAEGRLLSVTDAAGNKSSTTYNAAGDVLSRTDARGNSVRYEYDVAGRTTRMIDANGGVWSYGYCASVGGTGGVSCATCGGRASSGGDFCEMTDPNGRTVKQELDSMGRVVSTTDSLSHSTFVQYDKAGRKIAETDANGNATSWGYDEAGRLLFVRQANGAVTSYTYDKNGNKLTQKDAIGHTWSFQYDELGRLVQERDPLARVTSYTYDVIGNVRTRTDGRNQTVTYDYQSRRMSKATYSDGTVENYSYDAFGRLSGTSNAQAALAYDYDALNRVTSVRNITYGSNATVSYAYDAAGNRSSMTTVAGTVQYAYDAKNRMTQISDPVFGVFRFTYDPMDRRTQLRYANGTVTSYAYDNGYRMTATFTKDALGAVIDAWSYQYDAVGNRLSKTDANGKSETYRYDNVDRVTETNYADGSFERFGYDLGGNRKSLTSEAGTTTYSYDNANQMLSAGSDSLSYDGNGNVITKTTSQGTTTFAYDAKNRVASIGGAVGSEVNRYSVDGRRTQITGASVEGEIRPQYDLNGNAVIDLGNDNTVWVYRLFGPGTDEPLAEWWRVKNRQIQLHRDALGSVTAVTTSAGTLAYRQTYRAFGAQTRGSNANNDPFTRIGFTGRENSVGGLMQYRSRYYDTSTGRFLQQDTERGAEGRPPSLHRYTYVYNNPVVYVDPSGSVTVNPYPGKPEQKDCGTLLASIMWLTWAIEKRMSELKPGSLPDFGNSNPKGSMWGHCVQIGGLQISLMLHVNEFFKRCKPPDYGPQPDWVRVQSAYAEEPLNTAFPQSSRQFESLIPVILFGAALLILIAIFSGPVVIPAYAAVAILAILFLGTWVGTQFLPGSYQQTSMDLLTYA